MKLLQEFLKIINEARRVPASKTIDGWYVTLDDVEAERGVITEMLSRQTMTDPADYSEPYDVYLKIKYANIIVEKSREEGWYVDYKFNPSRSYIEDDKLLNEKFIADLKNITPRLRDENDDEVNDPRATALVKSIVEKYAEQGLLEDITGMATEKHMDAKDWRAKDDDGDYDGDDRVGNHPFY